MAQPVPTINGDRVREFLQAVTGSSEAHWSGKMQKMEQLYVFGEYLGRGTIIINFEQQTIAHEVIMSGTKSNTRITETRQYG
jgi:hypothetical protein